jgi:hypothetical protein
MLLSHSLSASHSQLCWVTSLPTARRDGLSPPSTTERCADSAESSRQHNRHRLTASIYKCVCLLHLLTRTHLIHVSYMSCPFQLTIPIISYEEYYYYYYYYYGPGSSVGIATELRAGRSGDRMPVEARFSAPVQTGPGFHSASCKMGTGSLPGVKYGGACCWPLTPF